MANGFSAIWYSTDYLSLRMVINKFKEFLYSATSTGGIPNNANIIELSVLSCSP